VAAFLAAPHHTAHKASPTFPNRDGAFRLVNPIARHPRRSTTRVPWAPHTRQRTFAPAIFPPALGTIGGNRRRAWIVFISIVRSIEHSHLANSERRSFTPHYYHQPYRFHQPVPSRLFLSTISLVAPSHLSLALVVPSADCFTPHTTPLPTLAPPLQNPPKPASWPTTRLRQSRPWGIGPSNRPLVCSSKAGWVGWTMTVGRGKTLQVTRASKARSFHHRPHIPW
jgi:hypothetical protein